MAAVAVAPRTDRNHTVDASPTLMPLLFKTLKKKIHLSVSIILNIINHPFGGRAGPFERQI